MFGDAGSLRLRQKLCESPVNHQRFTVVPQHHVAWFDVEVREPGFVHQGERLSDADQRLSEADQRLSDADQRLADTDRRIQRHLS